jgi:branched-chain amino acid transport system ATP-binding protein
LGMTSFQQSPLLPVDNAMTARAAADAPAAANILDVRDLAVAYGPVRAVRGVSFQVPRGAIVALLGANGAGKSSTLAAISGLVRPQAGEVLLDGFAITRAPTHVIVRRGVVHVPEGRAILATMSVEENLRLGAYWRGNDPAIGADLESMCRRFPILGERRLAAAGTLSGGEQQILGIARGLMARPRLLLLDEPSAGLSPVAAQALFREIVAIHADGVAIAMVEQNAQEALAIAGRGVILVDGRTLRTGPAAALAADPEVRRLFLGLTAATA